MHTELVLDALEQAPAQSIAPTTIKTARALAIGASFEVITALAKANRDERNRRALRPLG